MSSSRDSADSRASSAFKASLIAAALLAVGQWLPAARLLADTDARVATPSANATQYLGGSVRYDLGERLRRFEIAYDGIEDSETRNRSTPAMKRAVERFFSFRLADANRQLDEAYLALGPADWDPTASRWAASLRLRPNERLSDSSKHSLTLNLDQAYPMNVFQRKQFTLDVQLMLDGEAQQTHSWELQGIPTRWEIDLEGLPSGDYFIEAQVHADDIRIPVARVGWSRVDDLTQRIDAASTGLRQHAPRLDPTTLATQQHNLQRLRSMARGIVLETDFPAEQILREIESVLQGAEESSDGVVSFYGRHLPGQYWIALTRGQRTWHVRLEVPQVEDDRPMPVVIALHGAGGSENLFFDGYGNGKIRQLCAERNWLLVAPRQEIGGLPMTASQLVDVLDEMFGIDRERIFLVGHSMGVGGAMQLVGRGDVPIAGVVALGGGRPMRMHDMLRGTPFWVGVGSEDFAYGNARSFARWLGEHGLDVQFTVYPQIEHMVITQVALPEAFTWLDQLSRPQARRDDEAIPD